MKKTLGSIATLVIAGAVVLFSISSRDALADPFTVTYLAPGVQTPTGITPYYETFDSGFTGTTNFNGSSVTGTYSGSYYNFSADQFGGAGGTGNYLAVYYGAPYNTYSLSLSKGVNYFGLWFSALDAGNDLSFYNGSTLVDTFSPADYAALVGVCPTASPEPNFCGNPNADFYNQNSGQQYAYLNFYDTGGDFDKVVFSQAGSVGAFESDNHAVAELAPGTTIPGTPITTGTGVTPEPSSFILLGTGILTAAGAVRRRFTAKL